MSALDQLLQLVPFAAKKALATRASNVLLVPDTVPTTVKHGALVHKAAGPGRGSPLPVRVVAVLGPGATFQGLAATLLPIYTGATGAKPLTADELAKGLVVYNRELLPAGTWGNHQVGLCLPLPIEIDAAGAWTLNADEVRGWAGSFVSDWHKRLSTPPTPLRTLEPAEIEGEARNARRLPLSVPGQQWERALRNPSEVVLTFIAIVRQMRDDGPTGAEQALTFALAFLDGVQAHHVALLAATTAGNGILRRVAEVLKTDPLPAGTDMAKLTAARTLVGNALFQGPPAARTLRPHHEVPQTADLLAVQPGPAKAVPGAKADPAGGLHRVVLGRDVAVGRDQSTPVVGGRHTGPAFGGRLLLDPVLEDDAAGLNRGHSLDRDGRLALLSVHGVGGGPLDAVKVGGAGVLSVGLGAWSASDPAGVAEVLFRFKIDAGDEYDLFFAIHGLDVDSDPNDPSRVQLKKFRADGQASTVLTSADLVAFFGGTVDATTGAVTFSSEWAARFRLPALVSRRYRRAQILEALKKLVPDPVELAVASVNPFPKPYTLAVDGPRSTALKTAVDVDMDVDGFLAGLAATVPSRNTLSGALIDLTVGAGPTAYASSRASDDEDTFNIASMGKMLAMYGAFELRFRVRKALKAAETKGLDVTVANWDTRFRKLVESTWSGRVARGFPGFDTRMPARFPKLGDMFAFTTVPAPPPPGRRIGHIDFKHGTATDTDIIRLNLGAPNLSKMKFLELIKSMIFMSNAVAAGLVIDAVGYPYLNGALRDGGFFEPASKKGLWISGNYANRDWKPHPRPDVDAMDLSPRGTAHYKSTTDFMGNAKQLARLLALLDRGELFDGADAAACGEMRLIMRRHALPGVPLPDVSFIKDDLEATPPPVGPLVLDEVFSKIGIGVRAPGSTLEGAHDAAIIQRKKGATTLRYVAVVIGGYGDVDAGDLAAARRFTQLLDGAIAKVHP
jgi:hypothetical protein